jgi:ATP-dependent RNA helicase DDX5/DBP2
VESAERRGLTRHGHDAAFRLLHRYRFTRGDRGQGYYLDQQQLKKYPPKPKAAVATAAAVTKRTVMADPTAVQRSKAAKCSEAAGEGVPAQFLQYLTALHHPQPNPIQQRCWEGCVGERDLLVVAPPGSGKTLAYLLPAALHASTRQSCPKRAGVARPAALVLVPTRELALQVMAAAKLTKKVFKVITAAVYGGVPMEEQAAELVTAQPGIVIGTPGRTASLIKENRLELSATTLLVLDEADKMLGVSFEEDLQEVGQRLPQQRRTMLLSATFPDAVQEAATQWLDDPVCLRAKAPRPSGGSERDECISVAERVDVCAEHKKPKKLIGYLSKINEQAKAAKQRTRPRSLVFANKIKTVKFIGDFLDRQRVAHSIFHGGQPQAMRERVLRDFKAGKVQVLVATDVAGRGLHISGLEQVINYDFPGNMQQYIHRVGRTGRNNMPGSAFTFFTRNYAPVAPALVQVSMPLTPLHRNSNAARTKAEEMRAENIHSE